MPWRNAAMSNEESYCLPPLRRRPVFLMMPARLVRPRHHLVRLQLSLLLMYSKTRRWIFVILHTENAVYQLHKKGLLRNKVLVQKPCVDSTDGAIVFATTSKAAYAHSCAKQQLRCHLSSVQHYCCNKQHCPLCWEVCRTRRAKLMLDFVQTLPKSKRGNRAKCNSIADRILSRKTV